MFYGGVRNNFARYVETFIDLKKREVILVCGESHSYYDFVDKQIQGYMMAINPYDGSYKWGKYYQDNSSTSGSYIGLIHTCRYNQNNNFIAVSGQLNFYRPFIGTFNPLTGDPIKMFYLYSSTA